MVNARSLSVLLYLIFKPTCNFNNLNVISPVSEKAGVANGRIQTMLDWKKLKAAAKTSPGQLDSRVKHHVLHHLHHHAQPRARSHQHTYLQMITCTVEGLGIRRNRLAQLLDKVAAAPQSERAELLRNSLWDMLNNSQRSHRQKQNTKVA